MNTLTEKLISQQKMADADDKNLLAAISEHRVVVNGYEDLNETIKFRWHFPRGTFDKRMSALEIAEFLLPHWPYVLPFMSDFPRAYAEFQAMLVLIITSPKEAIDRVLPWIKPVVRTADDDYIDLELFAKPTDYKTVKHFDYGV